MMTIERYHDFSYGHRVAGHENKCSNLHGHNGRVTFTVTAVQLDSIGRVLDFSDINKILCNWVEWNWDHKFLLWKEDPLAERMLDFPGMNFVSFNPTAENMAAFLVSHIGPIVMPKGTVLIKVKIEETRKCSATYAL